MNPLLGNLPINSRRYFAVDLEACVSTLETLMDIQGLRRPSIRVVTCGVPGNEVMTKLLIEHAQTLAERMQSKQLVSTFSVNTPTTGRSEALRLMNSLTEQNLPFPLNVNRSERDITARFGEVYDRLKRQYAVAEGRQNTTEGEDLAERTRVYQLICAFVDAYLKNRQTTPELRLLVLPQKFRSVAIMATKLIVAAGQFLPPEHLLATAARNLLPAIVCFPDIERGFEFSNTHLVLGGEAMLPPWNAYDHLPYFFKKIRPNFQKEQQKAVLHIADLLDSLDFDHVFDIGCGDGSLLAELDRRKGCVCIGIDESAKQILAARAHSLRHTKFEQYRFPKTKTFSPKALNDDFECISRLLHPEDNNPNGPAHALKDKCVLLLGNTLPHIGARSLKAWLHYLDQKKKTPKYIVFDFLCDWAAALYGSQGIVHATAARKSNKTLKDFTGQFVTVLVPPAVIRGIVLTSNSLQEATNQPIVDYCHVTQYADSPEVYINLLRSWGYDIRPPLFYESGWGKHELYIAELTQQHRILNFPQPDATPEHAVNGAWYAYVSKLWRRAMPGMGVTHGSSLKNIHLFPAAILPFQKGRVWSRYIAADPNDAGMGTSAWNEIFSIWQWVCDPSSSKVLDNASSKPESYPPYAPGTYAAMLAEVPASVVHHVVDANPAYDLNFADLKLSEMEREWFRQSLPGSVADYQLFAIPIYYMGFPLFCVVAAVPSGSWTPSLLHHLLETEKITIETKLRNSWSAKEYEGFVIDAIHALGDPRRASALPDVARSQGTWTSWLETLPGLKIMDNEATLMNFSMFCKRHDDMVRRLTSVPFVQISQKLRECLFFTKFRPENEQACGHEMFTARHKKAAAQLVYDVSRVSGLEDFKDSPVLKYAIQELEEFKAYQYVLPKDDSGDPTGSLNYSRINWHFQVFKALFCRTAENKEDDYRVSALMVFAVSRLFAPELEDGKFRFNGEPIASTFVDEPYVKPKIPMKDSWLTLINLWKCVVPKFVSQCDICTLTTQSMEEVSISIFFTSPISTAARGASFTDLHDGLANLGELADQIPLEIKGFRVSFQKHKEDDKAETKVLCAYLKR